MILASLSGRTLSWPLLQILFQLRKLKEEILRHGSTGKLSMPSGKETVRQKLKTSPTISLCEKFKTLRTKVKTMLAESRAEFYNSLSVDLRLSPKRFWSLFKLKNKTSSVPERMTRGDAEGHASAGVYTIFTPDAISELYNKHFCSVFSVDGVTDSELMEATSPSFVTGLTLPEVHVSFEDVLAVLQHLDVNKATGPDGIAPRLLKETA